MHLKCLFGHKYTYGSVESTDFTVSQYGTFRRMDYESVLSLICGRCGRHKVIVKIFGSSAQRSAWERQQLAKVSIKTVEDTTG